MTVSMGTVWRANFTKRPISASVALAFAAVLGAMALLFALLVCAVAGLLGAAAWAAMRLAPRRQGHSPAHVQNGQVLEARRTADGWVVEATRGG